MEQFVLGPLEVLKADKWDKEGMNVPPHPSLLHSYGSDLRRQSAIAADSGADSKVKGRQTTIAVNVFVFYCPLPPAFP